MTFYVLDTNTASLLLRNDNHVKAKFRQKFIPSNIFLACPMVWYEIRRGLLAKDTRTQMQDFESLFKTFSWQNYTVSDWERAAELWAKRKKAGKPISDADLLIAVFALNRKAILVTNNEKDFEGLGVQLENWTT